MVENCVEEDTDLAFLCLYVRACVGQLPAIPVLSM